MEDQYEIEIKFEILDSDQFQGFLKDLEQISDKHTIDTYFDTSDCTLYKQGIFIRTRDNKRLDFKFNSYALQNQEEFDDHSTCEEYNFSLPLSENDLERLNIVLEKLKLTKVPNANLEEIRNQNDLVDSIVIDKARKEYKLGKFLIVHDVVKDLGEFVEIEYIGTQEEAERIKQEMLKELGGLKLKRMTVGYNEIYWRKNDFDTYLQGRYLYEEDYPKYRPQMLKSKQN